MPSALFIHRSVGLQMLAAAEVRAQLPDIDFSDLYANDNIMSGPDGRPAATPLDMSSGNTNPDGLAAFFREVSGSPEKRKALEAFDLVALKSCYSASSITSDAQLSSYQDYYEGLISEYISSHRDQQFVILSPPPRRPLLTGAAAAARARSFSRWLRDFASERSNCSYFDLFDLLADDRNHLSRRFRRALPIDQHPNAEGALEAGNHLAASIRSVLSKRARPTV